MTCPPESPRLLVSSVPGLVLSGPLVILPRCEPVEARVGAVVVVVVASGLDQMAGVAQVHKQVLVEALVPQASVEALDEAVPHGFPRRNVVPFNPALFLPAKDGVRRELRPVVADHHAGMAPAADTRADRCRPRHRPAVASSSSLSLPSPRLAASNRASEVLAVASGARTGGAAAGNSLGPMALQRLDPSISFSVATSSICSASSFLSLAFSASSAFRRFASDTSMPPYFERHLWNVASLIPCSRQSSFVPSPAWCSFKRSPLGSMRRMRRMRLPGSE